MIRWLFLVLIIVNLGIFAWGMHRELRPPDPGPVAAAGVPSLVLLSELQGVGEPDSALPSSASREPAPLVPPGDPDGSLPAPPAEAGPEPSPAIAEAVASEGGEPAAEAPFVGEGAPLTPSATPLLEPSEPNCFAIGPFSTRSDAETLRARIRGDAVNAMVRQQAQQEMKGYWVLIPPLASRAESVAELNRIKAKGIDDVWRFDKGDMANGISLGLFARRSQAESHQRALSLEDIDAEVQPRYTERSAYYVVIGPSPRPDLELELVGLIVREYPEQTTQRTACP